MNFPKEVGLLLFGGGAGVAYLIAFLLFLSLIRRKKKRSLIKILFIVVLMIVFVLFGLFSTFIFLMIQRDTHFGPFLPSNL
jgi:4-amino-4-deoxy-L-arabinose transferase-like glycosyltransferase